VLSTGILQRKFKIVRNIEEIKAIRRKYGLSSVIHVRKRFFNLRMTMYDEIKMKGLARE